MRVPLLLCLLASLTACSEEPLSPVDRPACESETPPAPEPTVPCLPEPETVPKTTEEAPDEEEERTEPAEWRAIELSVREDSDPADQVTRRDLEASKVFLEARDTPLGDVAKSIAKGTGRKVELLPAIFEELAASELLVTHEPETVTGAEALDRVCRQKHLCWFIRMGVVTIGPQSAALGPMVEVRYPIGEIALEPDALADRVRDTISRNTWDEGGEVAAREGKVLYVRAQKAVQREVLALLRKLRTEK